MTGYRIAGPHRAQFARRLVAHGEDEIHHRSGQLGMQLSAPSQSTYLLR